MKKGVPFFATHLRVSITEDKSDSGEEVALSRAIASNDHVVFWREGFNDGLLFVATLNVSMQ